MSRPPAGRLEYHEGIDGLRGVAVLLVLLYHAGVSVVPGGFVGVDVFFVISGFLITRLITQERREGVFSLTRFYSRRIRRLLPALLVMLVATAAAAWPVLTQDQWTEFLRSVTASALFVSNFFFLAQLDYFAESADLKPLLHTWSLAVEEQFYIFFPLLLLGTWRLGRKNMIWLLVALTGLSMSISTWQVRNESASAFFLLPSRWWELSAGVLLALKFRSLQEVAMPGWARQLLATTGFALVAAPAALLSPDSSFPGPAAIPPVMGAMILILVADGRTLCGRLLRVKPLAAVGLASYSIYLWHQPIFSLARNATLGEMTKATTSMLIAASLLAGFVSYHWVELPFRYGNSSLLRSVATASLSMSATIAAAAWILAGVSSPLAVDSERARLLAVGEQNRREVRTTAFGRFTCFLDQSQGVEVLIRNRCARDSEQRRLLVFGDSEAAHLLDGIRATGVADGFELQQWTAASCRAIRTNGSSDRCDGFLNNFRERVLPGMKTGDVILVSSNWPRTLRRVGRTSFTESASELMDALAQSPFHSIIVGATPDFVEDPIFSAARKSFTLESRVPLFLAVEDHREANLILRQLARQRGLDFVDPTRSLCRRKSPLECMFYDGKSVLFFDRGHLTAAGSTHVMRAVAGQIEGLDAR